MWKYIALIVPMPLILGLGTYMNTSLFSGDHKAQAVISGCVGIIAGLVCAFCTLLFSRTIKTRLVTTSPGFKIGAYVVAATFFAQKLAERHGNTAGPWLDDLERELLAGCDAATVDGNQPASAVKTELREGVGEVMRAVRAKLAA